LRQVRESEEIDGPLESVRIGARKQIEGRISGDGDTFKDDHGTGEEGKVIGDTKWKCEKDLVQLVADGHESFAPVGQGEKFRVVVFLQSELENCFLRRNKRLASIFRISLLSTRKAMSLNSDKASIKCFTEVSYKESNSDLFWPFKQI
jgi:hypothetical protein